MNNLIDDISVFHSSIRINDGKIIYFDPFRIDSEKHDADLIFITHAHYDHYSIEDIEKIINDNTIIVAPKSMEGEINFSNEIVFAEPQKEYNAGGIDFKTVHAYNKLKPFHPKSNKWLGYVVNLNGTSYYVAGDTDLTNEAKEIKCDVAFLPCGGMYTMNVSEASKLANEIVPKYAIPIHYGAIVGNKNDGEEFVNLLNKEIIGRILIK